MAAKNQGIVSDVISHRSISGVVYPIASPREREQLRSVVAVFSFLFFLRKMENLSWKEFPVLSNVFSIHAEKHFHHTSENRENRCNDVFEDFGLSPSYSPNDVLRK